MENNDSQNWGMNPTKEKHEKKMGLFEGYGALIGLGIVVLLLIIGFILSKLI
ncbi:MAG TPA: hypothetical protein VLE47_03960 [Candidatus Saccharimonadales bacterium]|nr:hypothetical protein [Candidatus Saccharimonadales bacterium]